MTETPKNRFSLIVKIIVPLLAIIAASLTIYVRINDPVFSDDDTRLKEPHEEERTIESDISDDSDIEVSPPVKKKPISIFTDKPGKSIASNIGISIIDQNTKESAQEISSSLAQKIGSNSRRVYQQVITGTAIRNGTFKKMTEGNQGILIQNNASDYYDYLILGYYLSKNELTVDEQYASNCELKLKIFDLNESANNTSIYFHADGIDGDKSRSTLYAKEKLLEKINKELNYDF